MVRYESASTKGKDTDCQAPPSGAIHSIAGLADTAASRPPGVAAIAVMS